jgi:transcriptional regulator CtsR
MRGLNMEKVLISLPDQLAMRLRATIPQRQRSKVITHLIEEEIQKREHALYQCALAVEKDAALKSEMAEWDVTIADGLTEEMETIDNKDRKKQRKKEINCK